MKSFHFNFYKAVGIIFITAFIFTSCDLINSEKTLSYDHKIQLVRKFCDSFGNGYNNYYYDAQNKLLRTEWALSGNTPDSEDFLYSNSTIKFQSYTYLLDAQNRVIKITYNNISYKYFERSYEYEGNLRVKDTYKDDGTNDYVTFYKYDNDRLVSDSTIYPNYTSVVKYFLTDTLRPEFMIEDMWGFSELKPKSKYLERLTVSKYYFDGVESITVDSVFFTYQITPNQIECNVSKIQTPKISDNCQDYQLTYTLE